MFTALNEAFVNELESIKNSYYKLFLLTLFPLLSFILIIAIFYSGVVRDLPITVIDNDKSKLSSRLLFNLESSPTIKISNYSNSHKEALTLLQSGKVYAILVIPSHFYRDILLQKQPKVSVMLNTQYILIGKILTSALTTTLMSSSAEVEYVKNLQQLQNPYATLNSLSPIGLQVTPFFNTYQNYFLFLVSALLPAIWQIFIVLATLITFGKLFKSKREKEFFKDEYVASRITGKLLPYTFAYTLIGIMNLFYIYGTLGWSFQGSFALMIFATFVTVVAYQAVALTLFVTGFDYARSLSLGAVYTAPAFAFIGVTFPSNNMNDFSLFWRDILPITHYIELQISQANYGLDIFLELEKLLTLFSFWMLFIVVVFMFKKRLKRKDS